MGCWSKNKWMEESLSFLVIHFFFVWKKAWNLRACYQHIGCCLFSYPGFRDKCDTTIKLLSDTRNTINLVPIATTIGDPDSKESACYAGDQGSDPGSRRSPGEGNGYPLPILASKTPWAEEPGRLQSMGPQRVGHNWAIFTFFSISK